MTSTLEDVAFLANSANRIAVLEALTEGPQQRSELQERVGVSRVTLARIVADLEAREWIQQSGQMCGITPLGAWVTDEFTAFLDTMADERRLREILPWVPVEHLPFDVRCLRDATIIEPTQNNISAHVEHVAAQLRSATRVRVLSSQAAPPFIEATRSAVESHSQQFEAVLALELLRYLLDDPSVAPQFRELLDAPLVTVHTYDGEIPFAVFVADGTTGILLTDHQGVTRALVLTDDDIVYDWAVRTFQRYRVSAEPADPQLFTV